MQYQDFQKSMILLAFSCRDINFVELDFFWNSKIYVSIPQIPILFLCIIHYLKYFRLFSWHYFFTAVWNFAQLFESPFIKSTPLVSIQ
jgi:hypothetical protein